MRKEYYDSLEDHKYISLAKARDKRLVLNWSKQGPAPKPAFVGTKVLKNYPLESLLPYIDW